MRKRIHQKVEEIDDAVAEKYPDFGEHVIIKERWRDPIYLSQEINKELYDLNVTAEKILTTLKWGLAIIGILLLFIAFK